MVEKEQARGTVRELVEQFRKLEESGQTGAYNETLLKQNFLDRLFEALGWDLHNRAGRLPQDLEVLMETGAAQGRPDYAFRIAGKTQFFVEAKAPGVGVAHPDHILQAKSYAWSKKEADFAILTDFDRLHLYDVSLKPSRKNPRQGLVKQWIYADYIDKFDELWGLLSRDSVEAGELGKLLLKDKASRQLRVPVDEAFLDDLQQWRETLAKDLYKCNPKVSVQLLNEVVQRMLDRMVFIRIAEDRGVLEPRGLLRIAELYRESGGQRPINDLLLTRFKDVNARLNGEIFKPHAVEEAPYQFDSAVLVKVIEGLYGDDPGYRFDVIPVELLGTIYERYLGNTIRLTPQRVKVEEKPEVRKAGGVFYTPKYIVDYIVENTVGKLVEGKSPDEVAKLKILDPACGSGSFLLGAYQKLIDYHIRWYQAHPEEAKGDLIANGPKSQPRLTIQKKAEILKNSIHGVDIDQQAVEITMMSLYVKALEGERVVPQGRDLLPRLSKNIVCGNSLIGTDAREVLGRELSEEEARRVNAFDWKTGFADIFEQGGFDAVIGNPPYIRIQTLNEWAPEQVEYFGLKYKSAGKGNYDIYGLFIERGLEVAKPGGYLSYIVGSKWLQANYAENLRAHVGKHVTQLLDFKHNQVFEQAFVNTCVLTLSKTPPKEGTYLGVEKVKELEPVIHSLVGNKPNGEIQTSTLAPQRLGSEPWHFQNRAAVRLIEKLKSGKPSLEEVCERIFQGLKTSADKIYLVKVVGKSKRGIRIHSPMLEKEFEVENGLFMPLYRGSQVDRYELRDEGRAVLFPYNEGELIAEEELKKKYPLTYDYLLENKKTLESREDGKMKNKGWYAYIYPKSLTLFDKPKLMTPDLSKYSSFAFDVEGGAYFIGGAAGGYGLLPKQGWEPRYVLALLNSRLLDWFIKSQGTQMESGFYSFEARFIRGTPIRPISPSNPADKKAHDELVRLVDRMLELHKKRAPLPESAERVRVEREIEATDAKIDEIVYKLYSITDEERKIIEGQK